MLLFRVIGRMLARFFGGLGRFTIGIFKFIGRHEMFLGGVVIAAIVVGGIWLLLTVLNINIVVGEPQPVVSKSSGVPSATAPASKISTTNAPQITESFMRGQIYFNADDVWNSLDPQYQNQLAQEGRGKDYFVRQLTQLKDRGLQYQEYRYIGGYDGGNGHSIHFYVARFLDNDKTMKDASFTLVVSAQGKIIAIN